MADRLARAGIGELTIVDKDKVELSNLQRQLIFTEQDVGKAKVKVVADHLRKVNSEIKIRDLYRYLYASNIESTLKGVGLVVDAVDSRLSRFQVNDYSVKYGIPWIFNGIVKGYSHTWFIEPGKTACLRCLFRDPPPMTTIATMAGVGVLNPTAGSTNSVAVAEVIKYFVGMGIRRRGIFEMDLINNSTNTDMRGAMPDPNCPCCKLRNFKFLVPKVGRPRANR